MAIPISCSSERLCVLAHAPSHSFERRSHLELSPIIPPSADWAGKTYDPTTSGHTLCLSSDRPAIVSGHFEPYRRFCTAALAMDGPYCAYIVLAYEAKWETWSVAHLVVYISRTLRHSPSPWPSLFSLTCTPHPCPLNTSSHHV